VQHVSIATCRQFQLRPFYYACGAALDQGPVSSLYLRNIPDREARVMEARLNTVLAFFLSRFGVRPFEVQFHLGTYEDLIGHSILLRVPTNVWPLSLSESDKERSYLRR